MSICSSGHVHANIVLIDLSDNISAGCSRSVSARVRHWGQGGPAPVLADMCEGPHYTAPAGCHWDAGGTPADVGEYWLNKLQWNPSFSRHQLIGPMTLSQGLRIQPVCMYMYMMGFFTEVSFRGSRHCNRREHQSACPYMNDSVRAEN